MKSTLRWLGIVLTALLGVVLLGGDKITSGITLLVTAVFMTVPLGQRKLLRRVRIGWVCAVACMVIWNISTTDLPSDYRFIQNPNLGQPVITYTTGIRFFDQVIHIFNGFLAGRIFLGR